MGDPTIGAQPLSLDSLCVGGSLSSPLSVSYSGGVGSRATSGRRFRGDFSAVAAFLLRLRCRGRTRQRFGLLGRGGRTTCFYFLTVEVLRTWVGLGFCGVPRVLLCPPFVQRGRRGSRATNWRDAGAFGAHFDFAPGGRGGHHGCVAVTQSGRTAVPRRMERRLRCWRRPSLWRSPGQALCLGGEALSFAVDYEQGTGSPATSGIRAGQAQVGVPVAEATSDTFTPPVSAAGETWYYCVVPLRRRLLFDSVFLGAVSVVGDPTISAQPLSLDSLCVGGSLSSPLSVSYSGELALQYQWSDGSG